MIYLYMDTHTFMNIQNMNATEARSKIFIQQMQFAGEIKRGILISRMHVSEQTFTREYLTYLDMYPTIKYDKPNRIFRNDP